MKKVANIRWLVSMTLVCTALLAQAGGAMAQENCEPSGPAGIVVTDPTLDEDGIASTENFSIDIKGVVINPCSLSGIASENASNGDVRNANKVTTNFADSEDKWFFTIPDVELNPATEPGESETNEITITAAGTNPPAPLTVFVTHTLPAGSVPPDGILNPTNTASTKGKVTWSHVEAEERFSTNARLIALEPFEMPCDPDNQVIVTLLGNGADGPVQLFSQMISSADANTCHANRYRETGPRGGIRDLLIEPRSDGELTFYVFAEQLDFGPSTDALVRSLSEYTLVIQIVYPDRALEWQVDLGPGLSFETFSNGNGDDMRTVARFNR